MERAELDEIFRKRMTPEFCDEFKKWLCAKLAETIHALLTYLGQGGHEEYDLSNWFMGKSELSFRPHVVRRFANHYLRIGCCEWLARARPEFDLDYPYNSQCRRRATEKLMLLSAEELRVALDGFFAEYERPREDQQQEVVVLTVARVVP